MWNRFHMNAPARYGHSGEVFGSDKMFIFGGVGDASVYRDDLWFLFVGTRVSALPRVRVPSSLVSSRRLFFATHNKRQLDFFFVDLSLPEPLEMELQGASAGMDISLPPIDSFEEVDRNGRTYEEEERVDNNLYSSGTTNGDQRDLSNIDDYVDTIDDDGSVGRASTDLRGMRDDLSLQLNRVSTDTRRFLLDENRRSRELATRTRRHLWETFTAGLDIVGLNAGDDGRDESLTDTDVTRMLKEARILVDDDGRDLNENEVILTSYYAASYEKKLKRFDLRLREIERRLADQEREIENHRRITDGRQEEVVAYFEAKLEHEVKAAEARIADVLLEQRRQVDEAMTLQRDLFVRELEEMRTEMAVARDHVVVDISRNGDEAKEKEEKEKEEEKESKEEMREKVKKVEDDVAVLVEEMKRMKEKWDLADEERDREEEGQLAEFEANLKRTMEGADALGSLMARYFHKQKRERR